MTANPLGILTRISSTVTWKFTAPPLPIASCRNAVEGLASHLVLFGRPQKSDCVRRFSPNSTKLTRPRQAMAMERFRGAALNATLNFLLWRKLDVLELSCVGAERNHCRFFPLLAGRLSNMKGYP
ncbi:hypothetical protein ACVISU_006686 [Bradyrhizobium sp. USDA 4452]